MPSDRRGWKAEAPAPPNSVIPDVGSEATGDPGPSRTVMNAARPRDNRVHTGRSAGSRISALFERSVRDDG